MTRNRVLQGQGVIGSVEKLKRHLANSGTGGGRKMLLLRADEAVKVRFLEDPESFLVYFEHYDGDRKAFVPAIDNDPLADHPNERVKRASERYLVNVLNLDSGQVQLLKMGKDLSNRIMMRYQRASTLMDRPYEIMRTGAGLDTTYDVEAGEVTNLDLSQFQSKIIDKEHFLLEQVDDYYGTTYAEDYRSSQANQPLTTVDAPLTEEEEPPKPKQAKKKTQAELDAENPLLDEDEKEPMPWEAQGEAVVDEMSLQAAQDALDAEDPWLAAKAEGLPCIKGPDGLCQICSHDVANCVVKS